jgi:hypothetical protein
MSSDSFRDLSSSLLIYCEALESILQRDWSDGSIAATEAADSSLAGDWGRHPGKDALLTIRLLIVSTLDHLRAFASLVTTPRIVYSLASVARGALEAGAQAYYFADPVIDLRERVRRYINGRLLSLHESRRLMTNISPSEGTTITDEVQHIEKRILMILSSADRHGFKVHKGDEHRPPYIGTKVPGMLSMAEMAISRGAPGLGGFYWRSLSAVAHSQAQGLVAHAEPISEMNGGTGGVQLAAIGLSAKVLALRYLGVILCATAMAEQISALMGSDAALLRQPTVNVLRAWSRVAEISG